MKMNKLLLPLLAVALLWGCSGEDRSGEYYALITQQKFIQDVMLEHYLWYEHITPMAEGEMIGKEPDAFLKSLLYSGAMDGKGDKYSYLEQKNVPKEAASRSTIDHSSTYGIDFELQQDVLKGTAHVLAHVLYVLPNSPAEKAGLKRGDWIAEVDGKRVTNNNSNLLVNGTGATLTLHEIVKDAEGQPAWNSVGQVRMEASRPMEINPILVSKVLAHGGKQVGYLVYNEFSPGPDNQTDGTAYDAQLRTFFLACKQAGVSQFVLDLRYNSGGHLSCAQALASMLAPRQALGKVFATLTFNDKQTPQVVDYPFDEGYADANLDLQKVYVLVSRYTASASEAVINGLIPYMGRDNVVLIGETTEGKNVAMESFTNETIDFILWPVVAYVANADGQGDYGDGFTPQYPVDEHGCIETLRPLGDEQELLLNQALKLMDGDSPNADVR